MGVWRSVPAFGRSCGVAFNCWRRSGEALIKNQCSPSPVKATEAWVLCSSWPFSRAARQPTQPQFHCGTPPPAAAPRTTTRSMIRLLERTLRGGSQANTVSVVRKPAVTERPTCAERRSPAAYLRVALTYMLISMPQGTSTIFGAFQAISALHFREFGRIRPTLKLVRVEKFASEIFPRKHVAARKMLPEQYLLVVLPCARRIRSR